MHSTLTPHGYQDSTLHPSPSTLEAIADTLNDNPDTARLGELVAESASAWQAAWDLNAETVARHNAERTAARAESARLRLRLDRANRMARATSDLRAENRRLAAELAAANALVAGPTRTVTVVRWTSPDWGPTTQPKSRTFWTRQAATVFAAKRRAAGFDVELVTWRAARITGDAR